MSESLSNNNDDEMNVFLPAFDNEALRPGSLEEDFAADGARRVARKFNDELAINGEEKWSAEQAAEAEAEHNADPSPRLDVGKIRQQVATALEAEEIYKQSEQ